MDVKDGNFNELGIAMLNIAVAKSCQTPTPFPRTWVLRKEIYKGNIIDRSNTAAFLLDKLNPPCFRNRFDCTSSDVSVGDVQDLQLRHVIQ